MVEISAQATAAASTTATAPAPPTTAITMKPSVDRRRKTDLVKQLKKLKIVTITSIFFAKKLISAID